MFTDTAEAQYFLAGNVVDGRDDWTADNAKMFDRVERDGRRLVTRVGTAVRGARGEDDERAAGAGDVLAGVGAMLPHRDAVDARIVAVGGTARREDHRLAGGGGRVARVSRRARRRSTSIATACPIPGSGRTASTR